MLLAIDAGNTNIVFAVCDGEVIRNKWRLATNTVRTSDEYAVWLAELLQLHGLGFARLTGAVIGTVVPALLFDLRLLCRQYLKCEREYRPAERCGRRSFGQCRGGESPLSR